MTDQQESSLGAAAQQALDNPALQEALSRMKATCAEEIKKCPIRDTEGLTLLVQAARITDSFERVLNGILAQGKLADARINVNNERQESRIARIVKRFP